MKRSAPLARRKPLKRAMLDRGASLKLTEIKRTAIKKKPRRHDNQCVRQAYRKSHPRCAMCGFRAGQPGGWLEVAHILGGRYGRIDDERNLLMLCVQYDGHSCHRYTEPIARFGLLLALKRETDPAQYDRAWLEAARGRPLGEELPVPSEFRRERARN